MRRYASPIVPWAVGHVGFEKNQPEPRLWGGSFTPGERKLPAGYVASAAICGNCGLVQQQDKQSGWSTVPDKDDPRRKTHYCPRPGCCDVAEQHFYVAGSRKISF
jgi:hypothetical protein